MRLVPTTHGDYKIHTFFYRLKPRFVLPFHPDLTRVLPQYVHLHRLSSYAHSRPLSTSTDRQTGPLEAQKDTQEDVWAHAVRPSLSLYTEDSSAAEPKPPPNDE